MASQSFTALGGLMHTEDGKNILKLRPSTFFPSIVLSYDKIIELLLIFHQTALQPRAEQSRAMLSCH